MRPRGDGLMRWAILGLIGVTGLTMLALLYRLATMPSW
jgi:ubiquinone biosynthesis protein